MLAVCPVLFLSPQETSWMFPLHLRAPLEILTQAGVKPASPGLATLGDSHADLDFLGPGVLETCLQNPHMPPGGCRYDVNTTLLGFSFFTVKYKKKNQKTAQNQFIGKHLGTHRTGFGGSTLTLVALRASNPEVGGALSAVVSAEGSRYACLERALPGFWILE